MKKREKARCVSAKLTICLAITLTVAFLLGGSAFGEDGLDEAVRLYSQGVQQYNRSDFKGALYAWEKGLELAKGMGNKQAIGVFLTIIGVVYADLGDYPQALSYYEKALKIHREIGVPTGTEEANMGDVYLEEGRLDKARAVFERLNYPIRLGRYYLEVKDYEKAQEKFTRSLKRDEEKRNAAFLVADYIGLGLSYEGLKDYQKAKDYYRKGVEFIERQRESLNPSQRKNFFAVKVMGFPRLEPYEGLARVAFYLKNSKESLFWAENTKARILSETIARRHATETLNLPSSLSQKEKNIINRIASLYKQQEIAFKKKNTGRLREIEKELTALKHEKREFIGLLKREYPEYASLKYPKPARLEELILKTNEVLIEYEVTETCLLAWMIKKEGAWVKIAKFIRIPLMREELNNLVKEYRSQFVKMVNQERIYPLDTKLSQRLYSLLLKDFLPLIKKDKKIIIIPDEILGVIPFEALTAEIPLKIEMANTRYGSYGKGISYLGDDYQISYYQSATALSIIRNLKKEKKAKKAILCLADPIFNLADGRLKEKKIIVAQKEPEFNLMKPVAGDWNAKLGKKGSIFPDLPLTSMLAEMLKGLFGNEADILTGLFASEEELRKKELDDYRYLIFATHGILDQDIPYIKEPALVLNQVGADPEDSKKDGFLTLTEVMSMRMNAYMAALTACNTGLGKNVSGEGVMGLGRAFQYAGARSVLVSLWSVEYKSTNLLSERLFIYLKEGKDSLEALRLARQDIRKAGYEHPFFWAPFILVGER